MSGNPPRLHRRATRSHSTEPPPKFQFNFKKLKELLCCLFAEKINDVNQPNDRINRLTTTTTPRKLSAKSTNSSEPSNNLKIQQRKSQSSRRGSRRSIRAAINERKEMENLIQAHNNQENNNNNNLDIEPRNSRMSISNRQSVNSNIMTKETEKQILKNFRKQTRMNTANNLRRNSTVGEQMQMELRRTSQLRRGSRAEVSSDMWEKLQSINLNGGLRINNNDVSTTRSGITLAVEQVPEENEDNENNNNNHQNSEENNSYNYDSSRTSGGYVIGLIQNSDSVDNNNNDNNQNSEENNNNRLTQPNHRSSILKQTPSNMSVQSQSNKPPISVNSCLLAASYASKLQDKTRKSRTGRRSSIAFGDETTVHYDKHDRNYDRRGSFLHQQSRSILNIPVIEEGTEQENNK